MQITPVNNNYSSSVNLRGRFYTNRFYNEIIASPNIKKRTLNNFKNTLRVAEGVDDGKVYSFFDCEHIIGNKVYRSYFLFQYDEGGSEFVGINPFSAKIIGALESTGNSKDIDESKILYNFNQVLRKKYRPHFHYDDKIKKEIYELLNNGNFKNNDAVQEVLNLPYTSENQLIQFKNILKLLSKNEDGIKYHITESEIYPDNNTNMSSKMFRLYGTKEGFEPVKLVEETFGDDGDNNVLRSINSMLDTFCHSEWHKL